MTTHKLALARTDRIRVRLQPKPSTSFRLSILARRQLADLVRRYSISRTALLELAIDRMYHEETDRRDPMPPQRMSYEAEPESIDERALDIGELAAEWLEYDETGIEGAPLV